MTEYARRQKKARWKRAYNRYLRKKQKIEEVIKSLLDSQRSYEFDFQPVNNQ